MLFPAGIESAGVMKKKKSIKRESLRQFYGNSVNSPNLTEVPRTAIKVRRSPRLAGMRFVNTSYSMCENALVLVVPIIIVRESISM